MEFFKPGSADRLHAPPAHLHRGISFTLVFREHRGALLPGAELRHRLPRRDRGPGERSRARSRAARSSATALNELGYGDARRRRGGRAARTSSSSGPRSFSAISLTSRSSDHRGRRSRGAVEATGERCLAPRASRRGDPRTVATRSASSVHQRDRHRQVLRRPPSSRIDVNGHPRRPLSANAADSTVYEIAARPASPRRCSRASHEQFLGERGRRHPGAHRARRPARGRRSSATAAFQEPALRDHVHHGLRRVPLRPALRAGRRHRDGSRRDHHGRGCSSSSRRSSTSRSSRRLLTIVGYSINDTIVVYDRIRENLGRYRDKKPLRGHQHQHLADALAHHRDLGHDAALPERVLHLGHRRSSATSASRSSSAS